MLRVEHSIIHLSNYRMNQDKKEKEQEEARKLREQHEQELEWAKNRVRPAAYSFRLCKLHLEWMC